MARGSECPEEKETQMKITKVGGARRPNRVLSAELEQEVYPRTHQELPEFSGAVRGLKEVGVGETETDPPAEGMLRYRPVTCLRFDRDLGFYFI